MAPAPRSSLLATNQLLCTGTLAMAIAMALADGAQAQEATQGLNPAPAQGSTGVPGSTGRAARTPAKRSYHLTLPLLFDGVFIGDLAATITGDGRVSVDTARLLALLGDRLSPAVSAKLRAASDPAGTVALSALVDQGLRADYDSANLQLKLSVPVALQGTQVISTGGGLNREVPRDYVPAAPVSGSATVTVRQTYNWEARSGTAGFRPVTVAGDVALNAGGADGVSLLAQLEYDGSRARAFSRGNMQLVHDDQSKAIRTTLGDLAPATVGFQTAPLMGGLSIERQYGAIQPLRNVRPSGRMSFVLDRPATVDVVVNGTTIRTMQLAAGQYNLRDFPFFNGLNQVDLFVVDEVGRRLLTSFSQYYSPRLLDQGILEFGFSAGVLETQGMGGSRYGKGQTALSGFARYGLTRGLTMGVNAQVAHDQWNIGGETALATPIGTFSVLASASGHSVTGSGTAFLAGYEGAFDGGALLHNIRFNLEAQTTSRYYTPLTLNTPVANSIAATFSGRVSATLPGRLGLGLSVTRNLGRDAEPDQTRYAANISRGFRRLNLSLSLERTERTGSATDNRGLFTLSLPLGRSQAVRAGYDTRNHTASAEFSQYQRDELGSVGMRLALNHADTGITGNGEVAYAHNRATVRLAHAVITDANGAITSQQSSYTLATQLAFAGDTVTVGRPVGPRFVIVDRHPTMEDAQVNVWQGPVRPHAQARADGLAPALVSAGSAYLPSQMRVDAANLPLGYDLGAGQYDLRPGMAGGYAVVVGSDASRVIMGVARDRNGTPLALQGGALVRVGDKTETKILIFTNRNGRFVANGIAPGDYILLLGENGEHRATITVPEKSKGTVMVGDVMLDGSVVQVPAANAAPGSLTQAMPPASTASAPTFPAPLPAGSVAVSGTVAAKARPVAVAPAEDLTQLVKGWRRVGHRRLQSVLARQGIEVDRRQLHRLYTIVRKAACKTNGASALRRELRDADRRYVCHYRHDGRQWAVHRARPASVKAGAKVAVAATGSVRGAR